MLNVSDAVDLSVILLQFREHGPIARIVGKHPEHYGLFQSGVQIVIGVADGLGRQAFVGEAEDPALNGLVVEGVERNVAEGRDDVVFDLLFIAIPRTL